MSFSFSRSPTIRRLELDPVAAWSAFRPGIDGDWNERRATHLVRRAAFGGTAEFVSQLAASTPAEAVARLLTGEADEQTDREASDALARTILASGDPKRLASWWVHELITTRHPLRERLTLFWHGHFATGGDKVTDAESLYRQNRLLRDEALGNFGRLTHAIAKDPAMLVYLDSSTNRKAHPNENYAREIMELFCLGEGHYSETDIRELARCFTGWEIRRGEFRFNRYQHDTGRKTILGESGEFGGEDGVRIVLEQKSAPEFIAGKLVRFFVMDEPVPSADLIAPLAKELRDSGMNIRPVLRRIFTSNVFYSDFSVGRKVRSPVELVIGLLRCLEGSTNSFELAEAMQTLGQGLLYPPSVKGWDGGRTWINSSTLLGRSNLVRSLITNEKTRFGKASLKEYLATQKVTNPRPIIDHLEMLLFAVPVPEAARERVESLMKSHGDAGLTEGLHALCTIPEFQLG